MHIKMCRKCHKQGKQCIITEQIVVFTDLHSKSLFLYSFRLFCAGTRLQAFHFQKLCFLSPSSASAPFLSHSSQSLLQRRSPITQHIASSFHIYSCPTSPPYLYLLSPVCTSCLLPPTPYSACPLPLPHLEPPVDRMDGRLSHGTIQGGRGCPKVTTYTGLIWSGKV